MQNLDCAPSPKSQRNRFVTSLACNGVEVRQAQRLRYRVFAGEMGAELSGEEHGIDYDAFDPVCDHLLVRDAVTYEVVGTYRLLGGEEAGRAGGFYAERQFDLSSMNLIRSSVLEVGRACVHPDYRKGAVIALLWAAMADYVTSHGYEYVIGTASIPLADGGALAASTYHFLKQRYLSPSQWRVVPRLALPISSNHLDPDPQIPALLKAYLRLGACICGEPAWDPEFKTAELLIMLPIALINQRYARHFMKSQ